MQSKKDVLDSDFMAARLQLLELAAFLDRVDRSEGQADGRLDHLKKAIPLLMGERPTRARDILNAFSYEGEEPVTHPVGPKACGVPL